MAASNIFIIPKPITNPKLRLFCFPFAGGSVTTYLPWIEHLSQEVELVFVQSPGRGTRIMEQAYDNMNLIIKELVIHAEFITSVPYIFFGHSLGSRIAFELACKLKLSELPLPVHFIASGSRAPHLSAHNKLNISELDNDEFIGELDRLNGTPKEVLENIELMTFLMPLLRADFKIADNYVADFTALPCPILVLHGEDDIDITCCQVEAWAELSEEDTQIIQLQGDHFFIHEHCNKVIAHVNSVIYESLRN